MTKFYLPRLKAHALSAAVGSGKTKAAIEYIARNPTRNFLYVAPTARLGSQTAGNLRKELAKVEGPVVRNVHLINGKEQDMEGKVRELALRSINVVGSEEGQVIVLTTPALLSILASIQRPEVWSVILDEAFQPMQFGKFKLGTDVHEGWAYFREVFDVDPDQGHRIVPKEGKRERVADIADGRLSNIGDKYAGLRDIAKMVCNPASRCELMVTPRVHALLDGSELPAKRKKKAEDTASLLEFASYVSPESFRSFEEVLFMSALFEQTILYHLWTRALGVVFQVHPDFPIELMRDIHGEQGRFLAVGYLLNEADHSSKENLFRSVLTGEPAPKELGQRVLDQVIRSASVHFGEQRFLLQVNKSTGYGEVDAPTALVPTNAKLIPAYAHGLNDYQDDNNVVALCVTNPTPQQLAWVMGRTGMTAKEVTLACRIHTVYQALGRCSIRQHPPTTDPKTLLVAGKEDAEFIHGLFPNCHWLKQIGGLPAVQELSRKPKVDGKVKALEKAVREHLGRFPDVDRWGTAALKEAMKTAMGTRETLGADCRFDFSDRTWRDALAAIAAPGSGSGWRREGHSLVRVTAADYGFPVGEPSEAEEEAVG